MQLHEIQLYEVKSTFKHIQQRHREASGSRVFIVLCTIIPRPECWLVFRQVERRERSFQEAGTAYSNARSCRKSTTPLRTSKQDNDDGVGVISGDVNER